MVQQPVAVHVVLGKHLPQHGALHVMLRLLLVPVATRHRVGHHGLASRLGEQMRGDLVLKNALTRSRPALSRCARALIFVRLSYNVRLSYTTDFHSAFSILLVASDCQSAMPSTHTLILPAPAPAPAQLQYLAVWIE